MRLLARQVNFCCFFCAVTFLADTIAGQVLGGRWKPLHYMLESCLFKDVFVACGREGQCYVRNDGHDAINATVVLRVLDVRSGVVRPIGAESVKVILGAGPAAFVWMCAGTGLSVSPCTEWSVLLQNAGCDSVSSSSCLLDVQVLSIDGRMLASNPSLLAPASSYLSSLSTHPAVHASVQSPAPPTGAAISIKITCEAPAMYKPPLLALSCSPVLTICFYMFVTLSTLAQGRFSQNSFFIGSGGCSNNNLTVDFLPFELAGGDQYDMLRDTLQVQHL